tara:strand:+ start:509 stop:820 length:312 start_codon:yes stop_codon:yes gene_type:complete
MKTGDYVSFDGFVRSSGFQCIKQDMLKAICTGHVTKGLWIPKSTIEHSEFIQSHSYSNGTKFDVYIITIKKWFQEKSDSSFFFNTKDTEQITETEIKQLINQI